MSDQVKRIRQRIHARETAESILGLIESEQVDMSDLCPRSPHRDTGRVVLTMKTLFPAIHRGAEFSPCQKYRYRLWRQWGEGRPLCMLMLNPSTADCETNDATVERQQRRAVQLGFNGLIVVNLFAFRSTDPAIMLAQADPVGPGNDAAILRAVSEAGMTICAWGTDGGHMGRSAAVLRLLAGRELHCLVRCKDGEPGHPLYVGYGVLPVVFQSKGSE